MDQRTRTHIKAVADALKDDAMEGGPVGLLYSGILTGLATAVRIADGSSAEDAMERILRDMEASGAKTPRPLAVGDVIHGFAYGVFGRDHYDCSRIVAVGPDWIEIGGPDGRRWGSAEGRRSLELCQQARDEPCPSGTCPLADKPRLTTA